MAEIGTVLGAAQTLFAALECSVLKEVISMLGYKSQLEDLKSTVDTLHNVLLDAAASDELNHTARNYIAKLRNAVYDADDLFDEFRTLAERKQLLKDCKLSEKVRLFFSSENSYIVAYKMAHEIKRIRKNLDDIARNHKDFGFSAVNKRIRNRREETSAYVNEPNIIGRDADVKAIVDKLLNLNGEKGASFLTVVGVGGMGKTALAQRVCADQRVKEGFRRSWWVCVGDEGNTPFDKKTILCNILDLATGSKHLNLSLEEIQTELHQELEGKNYLLVLDNVWSEDKVKWAALKDFLMLGAVESRIMVTTRSRDVANAIGNSDIHVLEGLSIENSWLLFEMTAFVGMLDSQAKPLEVEIGKKIVEQCSNVPLAIKVVGSLLCGEGLDKWQNFERSGLGGIRMGDNQIMSILKFSYHNLEPSLKSCFTYCAIFPKDYVINKDTIIKLWMAQGYIVPFDRGQSIKEASEEHFMILLRRYFFQDVITDKHGEVESFKMHDLMHDVAEEVAGHEILVATSETSNLRAEVLHVFDDSLERRDKFYKNLKFRTYLREFEYRSGLEYPLYSIFKNGGCLRTLTLVNNCMFTVPHAIGDLLHLRYLDFSYNFLDKLPDSITKLHNLQTLKLEHCVLLRELPKKFSRLVNLMHLNIKGCDRLKYMPVGMNKMTSLCELSTFVVADESSSRENRVGQLKDLKVLAVNLRDPINIFMRDSSRMDCLKSLPASLLSDITLWCPCDNNLDELVKVLDNRSSLRSLALIDCEGQMSNLPGALGHLGTLESLRIHRCMDWKLEAEDDGMAWRHFSHSLRSLMLYIIPNMKNLPKGMQYLTSLEKLTIEWCDNLEELPEWINCLSSLHSLTIDYCEKLKSIPEAMRKTTSLNRLGLYLCSDELNGKCQEPDGEDWPKIKHIPYIQISDKPKKISSDS